MPTARRLEGILAPIVTPFGARGELDRTALERNVGAHLAAGLHGIVIAGSTGEAPLLDLAERRSLVEWTRALVPRDRWVIAGAGAESTRATIANARAAGEAGADAVLVVAPHYYGASVMSAAALSAHYRAVADASPVPLVLYNIPKYMHFTLAPGTVGDLAQHENIIGIKDSSGDADLLSAYLNVQSERFSVLTGSGTLLATALRMGARGAILAVATFAPALALEVWRAASAGQHDAAASPQSRLGPVAQGIVAELGIAGVKAAHDMTGLHGGPPRSPLLGADDAQRRRARELLAAAGVPLVA